MASSLTRSNTSASSMIFHRIKSFTLLISVWIVAVSFLYSSIHHYSNPWLFHRSILMYELLPAMGAKWAAATIPGVHLLLAGWLVSRVGSKLAGRIAAIWLIVMALVQVSAIARGLTISCGCFGSSSEEVSYLTVMRNIGLAGLAIYSSTWNGRYSDRETDKN